MKQTGPLLFGFVIGMIMFLQYFIPHPPFTVAYSLVLDWKQVVFGISLILGVFSLLRFQFIVFYVFFLFLDAFDDLLLVLPLGFQVIAFG